MKVFTKWMCALLGIQGILYTPLFVHKVLHDKAGNFRPAKIAYQLEKKGGGVAIDLKVFDQSFSYLAMGHHAYAFLSEDGKYVLKFPRYHKFRDSFWLKLSFLPDKWKEKKIRAKRERFDFFLKSHEIAGAFLREETGLIALHLSETDYLSKEVRLIDGLGREHIVNLDQTGFVLQNYFPIYGPELEKHIGDEKQVANFFSAYFEVIASRYEKGIVNKDRKGWLRNYGFVYPDIAYEIDLGSYSLTGLSSSARREIKDCSKDFRKWITKNTPQYLDLFDREMEKAMQQKSIAHLDARSSKLVGANLSK